MVTGDSIFGGKNTPDGSNQTDSQDGEGGQPTPAEIMASQVADAVKEGLGKLEPVFNNIDSRLKSLEGPIQRSLQEGGHDAQDDNDDPLKELADDPRSFIQKQSTEVMKAQLGPLFETMMEDKVNGLMDRTRERVTGRFGNKAWEEVVEPKLTAILKELPPHMRTSERSWKSTVDSIIGDHYDSMKELETEVTAAKEERVRRDSPPGNLPPGRSRPPGNRITDEDKEFFEMVERQTGRSINPKEWLAESELGDDEDSWLPYIERLEAKNAS